MAVAIIVAAGKGRRLAGDTPKQYLPLNGDSVIARTLKVFDSCADVDAMVLVVPAADIEYCRRSILAPLPLGTEILLTAGGSRRQESVYNGLIKAATVLQAPGDLVAIHDGVRPLVTGDQISACIRHARTSGACILGIPAFDTLKRVDARHRIATTLNREAIWMAQTPQVFRHDLILDAHENARCSNFTGTDDAQLAERMGVSVTVLPGSRLNIKITTQEDLELARALSAI